MGYVSKVWVLGRTAGRPGRNILLLVMSRHHAKFSSWKVEIAGMTHL